MCASSDLPEHAGHCTATTACNSANPRADNPAHSGSDYSASGCALLFTALHLQRQFVLMADGVPVMAKMAEFLLCLFGLFWLGVAIGNMLWV
jgi:hypothetical protein